MVWWHWLVIGFVLAAAELSAPGSFYLLFLGISGIIVGAMVSAMDGIGVPLATWGQVLCFCVISFALLVGFRGRIQRRLLRKPASAEPPQAAEMTGEIAIPVDDIAPGQAGRVELRGTTWTARSESGAVSRGQRCRVVRVEGLTLWIRAE